MSVKLLKLHWRVFYWTFTGRIKKLGPRLELTLTKGKAEKILIVFPMDEPSFRVALYAFRDIGQQITHRRNYQYIIKEQFKDLFHLHSGTPILIKNSENEKMLPDEQQILEQLKNIPYEIIIDLNSNFHLGIARLISLLRADLKVGFVNPFSDQFYNVQLDISKSGIMEHGYKQVNMMLAL
jgi:ADP-heptose:LPS heptosyltransferase